MLSLLLPETISLRLIEMGHKSHFSDYEPVTRAPRSSRLWEGEKVAAEEEEDATWPAPRASRVSSRDEPEAIAEEEELTAPIKGSLPKHKLWTLKRGHTLSYAGLFLYTVAVFFRPYELHP